jgi:hypothetical protein
MKVTLQINCNFFSLSCYHISSDNRLKIVVKSDGYILSNEWKNRNFSSVSLFFINEKDTHSFNAQQVLS